LSRILIVVELDILKEYGEHEKFGTPTGLEAADHSPAPQTPAPANQGTKPTSFYGTNPPKPVIKYESPASKSL
jgi:replication factor A1